YNTIQPGGLHARQLKALCDLRRLSEQLLTASPSSRSLWVSVFSRVRVRNPDLSQALVSGVEQDLQAAGLLLPDAMAEAACDLYVRALTAHTVSLVDGGLIAQALAGASEVLLEMKLPVLTKLLDASEWKRDGTEMLMRSSILQ